MDTTIAALLFGIAVLFVVAVLLWRTGDRGGGAKVSLSFGQLFQAEITLDEQNTSSAENAVRRAAEERGEAVTASPVQDTSTRLARVLWVDDNPDNNLYETIALEQLGRFVTKATSTWAAQRYLAELPFSLVITDVGRGDGPRAGDDLIQQIRATNKTLPIIVYTVAAEAQHDRLRNLGAHEVVDSPDDLIRQVNAHLRP
jgi:CheY-like chemotaxis protein